MANDQFQLLMAKMDEMSGKVDSLEGKVDSLDDQLRTTNDRITRIELTLENEITPNIRAVAESHIDLTRKLDAAVPDGNKQMLYMVKVDALGRQFDALERTVQDLQAIVVSKIEL